MSLPARSVSIAGALLGSGALVLLSATPGVAATTVARASAAGLVLTVASTTNDSGAYQVSNDGTTETSTGNNKPALSALGGQSILSAGTLAQDAKTFVTNGYGSSVACAGLAGDGASLAAAGNGNCLTPGKNVSLNAGTFDLSNLTVADSSITMGLDTALLTALQPVLGPTQTAVQTALTAAGNPDLSLDVGAIQSQCAAGGNKAAGTAQLTDADLSATVAGTKVTLVKFPTHPAPNTKVLTNLDKVATLVTDAIQTQLATGLNGALAPAGPLAGQLSDAITKNVLAAIAPQLAPLEKNVLDGTLNKQSTSPGAIAVTALDLKVLPAAKAAGGVDLLSTQIGAVTCGPSGRVVVKTPPPTKTPTTPAQVPTTVPSGLTSAPTGDDHTALAGGALAALAALAGAMGVRSFRRSSARS